MERRKMVGVYALIALGLVLAMGFAPMDRGMAADSGEQSTDVMDDLPIEIYVMDDLPIEIYGDTGAIGIWNADLGDFHGITVILMDGLNDSSVDKTVMILVDDGVEPNSTVPLLILRADINGSAVSLSLLGAGEIQIDDMDDVIPLVMDDLPIEIY